MTMDFSTFDEFSSNYAENHRDFTLEQGNSLVATLLEEELDK